MSVNSLKTQTDELQAMYTAFKTGYQTHLDTTTDYENRFMNAFEDFSCFIAKGMSDLTNIIDKHIQLVSKIQDDHEKNKFEEGNFNKVSLIKKQDTTIRQLEIKVAELESKLAGKAVVSTSCTVSPAIQHTNVVVPEPTLIQCFARVGKAKYNISKQDAGFMDDFPAGTYVTKTGCVVGLSCSNMITSGQVFCPDHNNGKFEDIRQEPGTAQANVIPATVSIINPTDTVFTDTPEKKGKSRKQPAKKQEAEPAVVTPVEPVVAVTPVEPVAVAPVEPVAVTPVEPVVAVTPVEPVVVTPVEPVVVTPVEPVAVAPVEPVAVAPVEPVAVAPVEPVVAVTPAEPDMVMTRVIINEPDIEPTDEEELENLAIQQPIEEDISQELVDEPVIEAQVTLQMDNLPLPSFDDIEFYDDPSNNKTYYLDSKTKRVFEIAPNDEIGVFVKFL